MNPLLLLGFLLTCFLSVLSIYLAIRVQKELQAPEMLPLVIVLFGFLLPAGVFVYGVTNLKEEPKTDKIEASSENNDTKTSRELTLAKSLEKAYRKTERPDGEIPKTDSFEDDVFLIIDFPITNLDNLEKTFKDKVQEMDEKGYDFHKFNYNKPTQSYVLIFKKKTANK